MIRREDDISKQSATTPTDSSRRDSPWDEDNPFIAFRKFADEQFSALVAGFNSIPDLMTDVRAKAESQRSAWEQQAVEDHKRVTAAALHQTSSPWQSVFNHSRSPVSEPPNPEAREAARALLLQARNANLGVNPTRILRLFKDDPHPLSLDDHQWLSVEWFALSPYSPTNIETEAHLHQQGSMWRAAFEDLMSAELGKEQRAHSAWTNKRNDQKLYNSWGQAPVDWMLGLQCRGILPPQLPSLYQLRDKKAMDQEYAAVVNGKRTMDFPSFNVAYDLERLATEIGTFDEDERAEQMREQTQANSEKKQAESELDLYEAFLGKAGRDAKSNDDNVAQSVPRQDPQTVQKPNVTASKILSTLSTTETITLPDGTVTTKVVMKKRFADGREESTETVSTNHAQEKASVQAPPRASENASAEDREGRSKDKKGWFWS